MQLLGQLWRHHNKKSKQDVKDAVYLPYLKPILSGHNVRLNDAPISTITEVVLRAQEHGARHVFFTNPHLLRRLLNNDDEKATLDDYAGSVIVRSGIEFLCLNPLEHLVTTSTGNFLFKRYLSKFTEPTKWFPIPDFSWEVAVPSRLEYLYSQFLHADYIAVDIETIKTDLALTCSGYCGIWLDRNSGRVRFHVVVIPVKEEYDLKWVAKFNALPAPKIFQNGKYDNSYFLRWRAPVHNWKFDTAHLFHSWYSELPKRLDFITSFLLREWEFWKNESSAPIHSKEYYRYNAKDCFATALSFLAAISEMPAWALKNYEMEFPLVFPCLQAELTGIKLHQENFNEMKKKVDTLVEERRAKLGKMLGTPDFNPGSPPQVQRLFQVLGSGDVKKTGKTARDKVMFRHPLNTLILDLVGKDREDRKLQTSYFKDDITLNGRILYQLNPHGTDTARLASQEHHFWCGIQIHNIPARRTDIKFKEVFCADEGFNIGEGDYEQAESWDTGYLSGDPKLIENLSCGKDFHAMNASAFFGVPYEKIVDILTKAVIDKELRDLSKRTNHGANYNMGAQMLLDTMGIKNVLRARDLLGLPKFWTLLKVTQYLLDQFAATYKVVKGPWYDYIRYQVKTHKMLVSPLGWTRYCFGNPEKNKLDLNALVAHPPQNLNAGTLNLAWRKVFYNVALPNPKDFKLCAQIHDSIVFQYRVGRTDLVWAVHDCMVMDTPVTDIFGTTRVLRVPVAMKGEDQIWSRIKSMKR